MESVSTDVAFDQSRRLYFSHRLDEAAALLKNILAADPNHVDATSLLGVISLQTGMPEEAVRLLQRAISLRPSAAESYANLGSALQALGRYAYAINACEKAIELKPDLIGAYQNLAQLLQAVGRYSDAEASCRKAVSIAPSHSMLHNCLALSLQGQDRLAEAESEAREAIRLSPAFPQHWNTWGMVLMDRGRLAESIAALEKSISLNAASAPAHYNYAMALLLSGHLARGFTEYEWRWKCPSGDSKARDYSCPKWDGSDLPGKTLLLTAEQGFGDAIQFIRYLPQIAARCGRVVVASQPELRGLFSSVPGIAQFIKPDEPIEGIDAHLPLMSVPLVLGTTLETIPAMVPYLRAENAPVERWRTRTSGAAGQFKVGIAWAGNPSHANDRRRSIPAALLSPLADIAGIAWYSLQNSAGPSDIQSSQLPLIDLTFALTDFSETAAFIENLDLVITIDSAVAHLAGAMGKPTWILLPFAPDWRWMRNRQDSPWYPTARLFRQPATGDWASVVQKVREELTERTK